MRKLSPFVRSRLESQQRASDDHLDSNHWDANHPDANLLLAFAERNVSRRERAEILTHLAECPGCREVLALSSGASAHDAPPSTVFAKKGAIWHGWPVAAAAVLICSLIAIVRGPSVFKSSPKATSSSQPITIGKPASPVPAPVVPEAIEPDTARRQIRVYRKKQASPSQDVAEVAEALHRTSVAKSANATEKSNQPFTMTAQQAIVQAPPPNPLVAPAPSSTAPPSASANDHIVPNSMLSVAGSVAPFRTLLRAPRSNEESVWSLEASPRGGTVQKSADGGRTWRNIPVDAATTLYALSARGSDVWVGGADGKLFHSVDDGAHWASIPVGDENARFSGVIIGIDTRGDSITLKTDSGAAWTTDDGGAHWRRE